MSQDTQYAPISFIFQSKGIVARPIIDQTPQGTYLNLDSAEEREEGALSSRYGSVIVNRDPDGTVGGVNYLLPDPVVTISRLKYNAATWRYAGTDIGHLYRRVGDTQGQYTAIYNFLSGEPFGTTVFNCFGSGQPFLFIADTAVMLKDIGTGTPTPWGIAPPPYTASATVYAPQAQLIDGFNTSPGGYTTSNVTGWASGTIGTVTVNPPPISVNNFYEYTSVASGIQAAFNGGLATYTTGGPPTLIPIVSIETEDFISSPPPGHYSTIQVSTLTPHGLSVGNVVFITGTSNPVFNNNFTVLSVIDSLNFKCTYFSTFQQGSSGGNINGTSSSSSQALIFNIVGPPVLNYEFSAVGINGLLSSGTTTFPMNYISGSIAASTTATIGKTISLDLSQRNQATGGDLIALALALGTPANVETLSIQFDVNGSGYTQAFYTTNIALPTGLSAWTTVYVPMGNFTAMGRAGQEGWNWANITGWQIQVVTNATGSTTLALNGLYQQWGAGPSSFGGTGYDYRYTFYNAFTQSESNPSPIQYFDPQYGYAASMNPPISLRQAFNVTGFGSTNPAVTHIRIYRRGGTANQNWFLVDQIPNVPAGWGYKDVIPDSEIISGTTLQLDNDQPVTSSLANPIVTLLTQAPTSPGNTLYDTFTPQTLTVANNTATFLVGQIVDVGTPLNLEQVFVIAGGTGAFTAIFRLIHNIGEPVYVFSIPGQPCDLCETAYGQVWIAGDPNNPHYLYYSKPGYPEAFPPQQYIAIGEPSDPIMAVINFRGTLYVATLTTWYLIVGGATPTYQPTGSKHGLIAKRGWCQTESAIWYWAVDGIRQFRGADGPYMTEPVEWLFRNDPNTAALTPIVTANLSLMSTATMAFYNNVVYAVYPGLDGYNHRIKYHTIYHRWRNDDVNATAIEWEPDINVLLYSKPLMAPSTPSANLSVIQLSPLPGARVLVQVTLQNPLPGWLVPTVEVTFNGLTGYPSLNGVTAGVTSLTGPSSFEVILRGGATYGPSPETGSVSEASIQGYAICQDQLNDYDDGGWMSGSLVQTPINVNVQLPYQDIGKPHNPKQFNTLEMDVDTEGQDVLVFLSLDDGASQLALGPINTGSRLKVQVPINAGDGVEAYRVSPILSTSVTQAPIIYQMNLYAAVLAAFRSTYDTYQIKFGTDEFKLAKQGYFDYTSTAAITVSLYADGSSTAYYTFTLPPNPVRTSDPVRERFAPLKFRLWRLIATSSQPFQLWNAPEIEVKPCAVGNGYSRQALTT